MSRISDAFGRLTNDGKKGFIPFITAGDPDLQITKDLIVELARAGATLIELGIPFSDPMADGPVIQRASERALRHGFGIDDVLQTVSDARKETDVPIILFSYFNPLLQWCQKPDREGGPLTQDALPHGRASDTGAFDFDKLAWAAKQAGIDGVLVTDLVPEEAGEFASSLKASDLDMIFLVAPTSTDERLKKVADRASGFIYAVSRAGITGQREQMSAEAEKLVNRIRPFSDLPIAVGFGISTPEHVRDVWRYADAAVVGSAIVGLIETAQGSPDLVSQVGRFANKLASSI
ncbi:MAG TPA: tryptophan synthase subunit alpha [Pyrinomonadaceae bacterium]|nr:tryptophan synthase subunit alpha [Pyrinomonadaceae bacterium]